MARSRWKVTLRNGPRVSRTGFRQLDEALAEARAEAEELVASAPLGEVKAIRDYAPAKRTKARIEISGRGLIRPPTAGLDIRGDNSVLGFTGSVRRRALKPDDLDGIFRELRRVLEDE